MSPKELLFKTEDKMKVLPVSKPIVCAILVGLGVADLKAVISAAKLLCGLCFQ